MSLLLFYFLYRNNWRGVVFAAIGAFLAHPTNVFLFVIFAPLYILRTFLQHADDSRTRSRIILGTVLCGLIVLLCGLEVLSRPRTRAIYHDLQFRGLSTGWFGGAAGSLGWTDLVEFLTRYGKLFLSCSWFGLWPGPWHDWAFWSIYLTVLVLGTVRLVRQRLWDRLALVVGLFFGLASLFLAVGPEVMHGGANRYVLFLVMPTILAFAFLLDRLIVAPTTRLRTAVFYLQCTTLLILGGASLVDFKVKCFDANRGSSRTERVSTFRTDEKDARCRALHLIARDRERTAVQRARAGQGSTDANAKTLIFVDSWWTRWTMQYLALPYRGIEVRESWEDYRCDLDRLWSDFRTAMDEDRAYAVCLKGKEMERFVRARLLQDRLQQWEFTRYGDAPVRIVSSQSIEVFRGRHAPLDPLQQPQPLVPLTAAGSIERR
jgi:hypothetical protein